MGSSLFHKLLLDDSDKDEIIEEVVMDSTSRNCRSYIRHIHLAGHEKLYLDYFANSPVYPEKVEAHDPYFVQKRNGGKKLGLSSFQKITTVLRMLAYGVIGDFMDEYVQIGETTTLQSLEKFVAAVVDIFSEEYLRKPYNEDITRLLAHGKRRGFPGMLGLIDCMY
ncbi:hypothetical protein SO802_009788 [Lithocarpus litseifolius]|uniref:Uncharacterized protein n=1 Tax=Lithocarpus litseifolius TaxID=425828 RepID=A0AAW2DI04_9ROSI